MFGKVFWVDYGDMYVDDGRGEAKLITGIKNCHGNRQFIFGARFAYHQQLGRRRIGDDKLDLIKLFKYGTQRYTNARSVSYICSTCDTNITAVSSICGLLCPVTLLQICLPALPTCRIQPPFALLLAFQLLQMLHPHCQPTTLPMLST